MSGRVEPRQSASEIRPGQVWQRSNNGSRVRVQGFSKIDGWVMVREVGGDRARSSYPRTPFDNGGFVLVEEADRAAGETSSLVAHGAFQWRCRDCGTVDGPISNGGCDVCFDGSAGETP